tara:strand:+ start:89 stop:286 length:198 start_codon:yes stop_codon:yes gene_type:complete
MAVYTFRNKEDATQAVKLVGVLVGDMQFYQPVTIKPSLYFSGQWAVNVPNLPPDMLASIADSIRS